MRVSQVTHPLLLSGWSEPRGSNHATLSSYLVPNSTFSTSLGRRPHQERVPEPGSGGQVHGHPSCDRDTRLSDGVAPNRENTRNIHSCPLILLSSFPPLRNITKPCSPFSDFKTNTVLKNKSKKLQCEACLSSL